MKKIFTFLFFSLFILTISTGQQKGASISFTEDEHDFGKIKEEDGKVTHKFKFINTGNEPLIIENVRASCGCTSPAWTKKPVAPGEEGYVSATYNPAHRPGYFKKSIHISSNSVEDSKKILYIKGNVLPKPETLESRYPSDMGDLRLKSNHLGFGKVYNEDKKIRSLEIVNYSDKHPITVTFDKVPSHLQIKTEPEVIKPRETAKIIVHYDASRINDWGFVIDRIHVIINNDRKPNYRFTISANITENFSNWTSEQRANAPHIQFEKKIHDFGTIKQNQKTEIDYVFENTGKSDLIIRKIKSTCGCTVVKPEDKVLSPGETSSLKAIFSSGRRHGQQNKVITVITNDPESSVVRLYLKGKVIEE